jgi:hypothetical protein
MSLHRLRTFPEPADLVEPGLDGCDRVYDARHRCRRSASLMVAHLPLAVKSFRDKARTFRAC